MRYEIQCGRHHRTVQADTLGDAWRAVRANASTGFSVLARFREYGPTGKRPLWQYITPDALEKMD